MIRAAVAMAAFLVAIGVVAVAGSGLSAPTAVAMAGVSANPDPHATPVVPVHGGCISGLNCGCIRSITGPCAGPPLLRHPAIHSAPQDARSGAAAGHT